MPFIEDSDIMHPSNVERVVRYSIINHMIDQKLMFDQVPSLIDENIFYKKIQKENNFRSWYLWKISYTGGNYGARSLKKIQNKIIIYIDSHRIVSLLKFMEYLNSNKIITRSSRILNSSVVIKYLTKTLFIG